MYDQRCCGPAGIAWMLVVPTLLVYAGARAWYRHERGSGGSAFGLGLYLPETHRATNETAAPTLTNASSLSHDAPTATAQPAQTGSEKEAPSQPAPAAPSAFVDTSHVDFTAPPFAPKPGCANVFVPSTDGGGLGHRMTAFFLAVFHAWSVGAAVAVAPDLMAWAVPRHAPRSAETSVAFVPELFGLVRFHSGPDVSAWTSGGSHATPWGELSAQTGSDVEDQVDEAAKSCGHVFRLNTGYPGSCLRSPTKYCVSGDERTAGAFQRLRPLIVALHAAGPAGREQLDLPLYRNESAAGVLTVAWHVRNGDISSRLPFAALFATVAEALGDIPVRHFVYSEFPIHDCSRPGGSSLAPGCPPLPPGDFTDAPGAGNGGCQSSEFDALRRDILPQGSCFYTPSVRSTALHLAGADILVYSGSSLVSIAATMALRDDQVRLHGPDKDGPTAVAMYLLDGSVIIGGDGKVAPTDVPRLAERVRARRENNAELRKRAGA